MFELLFRFGIVKKRISQGNGFVLFWHSWVYGKSHWHGTAFVRFEGLLGKAKTLGFYKKFGDKAGRNAWNCPRHHHFISLVFGVKINGVVLAWMNFQSRGFRTEFHRRGFIQGSQKLNRYFPIFVYGISHLFARSTFNLAI